jgi:hypothetical protein
MYGYRSLILQTIILLCQYSYSVAHRSAICFLTYRPNGDLITFAEQLAHAANQHQIDIFIMIDDNAFNISQVHINARVKLIQIPNEDCLKHEYNNAINLLPTQRGVSAWDKALLYFNIRQSHHSFIWLIEDDVFVPHPRAILALDELYSNRSDLVIARSSLNPTGDSSTWLWNLAVGVFPPPWSCSMVNVIGLSRRLLISSDEFVRWRGTIPFHEFFFLTLALQRDMIVTTPSELSKIVYRDTYNYDQIKANPNNIWHPVKDAELRKLWRERSVNHHTHTSSSSISVSGWPMR